MNIAKEIEALEQKWREDANVSDEQSHDRNSAEYERDRAYGRANGLNDCASELAFLRAEMEAAQSQSEPAEWQYKNPRTGKWCNFVDEKHRVNTIEDGGWEIRALYATPAAPSDLDYVPGELDRTAPARIWLQIDTGGSNDERDEPWPGADGVTWQDEEIGGLEIQYVRADLAAPAAPAAKHWHDLYRAECRLRQDAAAHYGQQILDLEAAAAPAAVVDGPVEQFLAAVRGEIERARQKFPGNRLTAIALGEEVGELCKAMLDEPAENVMKEAVQVACMAARCVIDGDSSVNELRRERGMQQVGNTPTHYVVRASGAWMVKEAGLFVEQGGLTAPWGKVWRPIVANSIEHARELAAALSGKQGGPDAGSD